MKTDIENRYIWLKGEILNVQDAKINVLSPTSQFGLNVFEGIRCYWNEKEQQLYAFRLDEHFKRLKRSQKLLMFEDVYSINELKEAFINTIRANEYKEDIAVRQTIFIDGFGSWSSKEEVNMFVAPIPKKRNNYDDKKRGLNCCVSSWTRINDNTISPRIKCGANYINSRMAQCEALRNGYDTTILLKKDGKVAEGPGSCLFIIRDGSLVTPQITDDILESITRDTIIKLAEDDLKLKVEQRSINRTELYMCDEAFLCGSAMEITPILTIDGYKIGNNEGGKLTNSIGKMYINTVTGEINKRKEWLTPIY